MDILITFSDIYCFCMQSILNLLSFVFLQIVVLARVIVDRDQVTLSAEGVTRLVSLLRSENHETVILSGKYQTK